MSRHLIRSFKVEIDSDSEARGHILNKQLNDFLISEIVPELERIMDEVAGSRELWQLDRLNLDLGECNGNQFTDEFRNRLLFRFREALRSSLSGISSDDTSAAEKTDSPKSRIDLLRHYLKHGTLPWWASETDQEEFGLLNTSSIGSVSIKELIDRMLHDEPQQLYALVRKMASASTVRKRLIRQLDDSRLKKLTIGIEDTSVAVAPLIDNILAVSDSFTEGGKSDYYREQIWDELFQAFVLKKESVAAGKARIADRWFQSVIRRSGFGSVDKAGKLRKFLAEERGNVREDDKNVWHTLQKQTEEYFLEELPSNWRKAGSARESIAANLDTNKVVKLLRSDKANQESYLPEFYSNVINKLSQSSRQKFTRFILDLVFGSRYGRISKSELLIETVIFFSGQLAMAEEDIIRYLSAEVNVHEVRKWSQAGLASADDIRQMASEEVVDETDWTKWKNQDIITSFLLNGVIPWNERDRVKEESLEKIFLEWVEKDPAGFQQTLRRIDWKQKPFVVKRILSTFSPELADRILEQLPRTLAQLMSPPPLSLESLLASPHLSSYYLSLAARNIKWSPLEWQPGLTIPVLLKEFQTHKPRELELMLKKMPRAWVSQLRENVSNMPDSARDEIRLSVRETEAIFSNILNDTEGSTNEFSALEADGNLIKAWKEEVHKFIFEGETDSPDTIDFKFQHVVQHDPTFFIRSVQGRTPSVTIVRTWITLLSESTLSRMMYQLAGTDYQKATSLAEEVAQLSVVMPGGGIKYNRWLPLFNYFTSNHVRSFSPFQYLVSAIDHLEPPKHEVLRLLERQFQREQEKSTKADLKRLAGLVSATSAISQAVDRFIKGQDAISADLPSTFSELRPEADGYKVDMNDGKESPSDHFSKPDDNDRAPISKEPKAGNDPSDSQGSEERKFTDDHEAQSRKTDSKPDDQESQTSETEQRNDLTGKDNPKEHLKEEIASSKSGSDQDDRDQSEIEKKRSSPASTEEEIPEPPEKEPMFINNAGLVILHPFITRLFSTLGLTDNKQFKDQDTAHRAAHILHYLVFHHTEGQEHEMTLEKVLCNIPLGVPLKMGFELTDKEKETCISLTKAAINYWEMIKKSSVDNFRASFLIREGAIYYEGKEWRLHVTPKGLDVLMEKLPWSIGMIRFPWMEKVLHVNWA